MHSEDFERRGNVVDVINRRLFSGTVKVAKGKIAAVDEHGPAVEGDVFLLPGFVDAHVHIESSMLAPSEFARAAVVHGTVATVSDPHEIGNVLGVAGVQYMLDNAAKVPFKFYFGAPSCVPATAFESAGAEITAAEVAELLDDPRIKYLSEMMNFPGVIHADPTVVEKLRAAQSRGKPIDGHAPGLRGGDAEKYFASGITTDHECFERDEALEKLRYGAAILIREGSAARNFDELHPLIAEYPTRCMLCSDDKHPDELLLGHINELVRRSVERGLEVMDVLQCACVNPVLHYKLDVGLLRPGDDADFIEAADLKSFHILRTYLRGECVAADGQTRIPETEPAVSNQFMGRSRTEEEFQVPSAGTRLNVIEAIDGQLITKRLSAEPLVRDGMAVADPDRDVLKLAVVNRYTEAPPAMAFVRNFGLKFGAMASSVAHDSHNVIAVGASDAELCAAINLVIENQGGLSVVARDHHEILPLPIAGLMSTGTCEEVGRAYSTLDRMVKECGSQLRAPFMTLSFMALLVIPEIKLSDRGLFDGTRFEFMPLFTD